MQDKENVPRTRPPTPRDKILHLRTGKGKEGTSQETHPLRPGAPEGRLKNITPQNHLPSNAGAPCTRLTPKDPAQPTHTDTRGLSSRSAWRTERRLGNQDQTGWCGARKLRAASGV